LFLIAYECNKSIDRQPFLTMSNRKPVCKKFLDGRCRGKCDYYHPKQKPASAAHHNHQKQHHQQPVYPSKKESVEPVVPVRTIQQAYPAPCYIPVGDISCMFRRTVITEPVFNKTDFDTFMNTQLPNVYNMTIGQVYSVITGKYGLDALEKISEMTMFMPDIMMLLTSGMTNDDWLKNLQTQFLPPDFSGLTDFTSTNVSHLLYHVVYSIYMFRQGDRDNVLWKYIALYYCCMTVYAKLSIPVIMPSYVP
jgi:hypothetical protein